MPKKNHLEAYLDYLQKLVQYSRSTKSTYTCITKRFLKYINEDITKVDVSQVTPEAVNGYIETIQKEYAIDSQTSVFYALRKYLLFLQKQYGNNTYNYYKQIDIDNIGQPKNEKIHNPLTPRRNTKSTRTPLTKQEVHRFFEVSKSNPRDNAILRTMYYTSQRRDSIFHININDIDRNNKEIKIYAKGKDGQPRVYFVGIDDDTLTAIDSYLQVREKAKKGYLVDNWGNKLYHKDALFLNGTGKRYTTAGFYFMIKKYCTIMGIERKVSPHIWRHTSISNMDESGMTEAQICLQSGHTNAQSLRRYIHPDLKRTKPLIEKALSRRPEPPKPENQPEIVISGKKPKENATDNYICKDISENIRMKELELQVERQKLELALKQADIELLKLKQNTESHTMYG